MKDHKQYNPTFSYKPHQQEDFNSTPNVVRTDKDLLVKDFFRFNDTEAVTLKGQKTGVATATSAYEALLTDFFITVPSVVLTPSVTLPTARLAGIGKLYLIQDISGSAASTTITVYAREGDVINNDYTTAIASNFGSVKLCATGTSSWTITT